MMGIKEHQEVWSFFDKKAGSRVNVNEKIAGELHKPVIK